MKLEVIVKALKWLEMDMDLDEVTFSIFLSGFGDMIYARLLDMTFLIQAPLQLLGGMYSGHTNIQESGERILCSQEQSRSIEQAGSFPQVKWKAC